MGLRPSNSYICPKFEHHPQKFFTVDLNNVMLKAYHIVNKNGKTEQFFSDNKLPNLSQSTNLIHHCENNNNYNNMNNENNEKKIKVTRMKKKAAADDPINSIRKYFNEDD